MRFTNGGAAIDAAIVNVQMPIYLLNSVTNFHKICCKMFVSSKLFFSRESKINLCECFVLSFGQLCFALLYVREHYANAPMQYIAIVQGCKNDILFFR